MANVFDQFDEPRYLTCGEAIRWGLSERAYVERQAKVAAACKVNDEEAAKVNKTPRKLRWDLPFVIRLETCQRNIMLGHDDDWEDVPQSR